MPNPVLIETTRGSLVESRHRGAIAVVDARGKRRVAIGDVGLPVFPRSAVKALQALPLVESGAADAYRFGAKELALACASHSGEPGHVATAASMLARAGCGLADLECGAHIPLAETAAQTLVRAGEAPTAFHNNCSGKHAGFICTACHLGIERKGYVDPDHPVQREITAVLAGMTGVRLDEANRAIDGCSIPTYAIPLDKLAQAFAQFTTGEGLEPARAGAAKRLAEACMAEPWCVAGTGRFDTDAMTAFPGRVFVKGGAEGIYCAAFPDLGLGAALKCDDGSGRVAETMMAAVIDALLPISDSERSLFADRLVQPVRTRRGVKVGEMRPAAGLTASLREGGSAGALSP